MTLLVVGGDDGNKSVAEFLELQLGLGVEDGDGVEVDSVVRVLGIQNDSGTRVGGSTSARNTDISKHVFGVAQVSLLLGAAKTGTAICLSLIIFVAGLFLESAGSFGLFLGNTLLLGLLEGSGGSIGLCLGFGGLLDLFALYFGVFGGIPRVENLWYDARLVTSPADVVSKTRKGHRVQVL